jgi:hypothetical protein
MNSFSIDGKKIYFLAQNAVFKFKYKYLLNGNTNSANFQIQKIIKTMIFAVAYLSKIAQENIFYPQLTSFT